jgi:phosphatidylinositol 3-kinase
LVPIFEHKFEEASKSSSPFGVDANSNINKIKMPAKVLVDINKEKWVNVTWMPHTTLSQTSHVYMRIRSVHAVLLDYSLEDYDRIRTDPDEWKVRVGVYGLAGLPLIDLQAHTSASICKKRTRSGNQEETPFVGWATHDCFFDCLVTLPVRWRDLPRDAYLLFEVTVALGTVLYRTTMPFFSRYGKLATGLQKLELTRSPLDSSRNYGLYDLKGSDDAKSDEDDDPVWKAVVILDKIQRMEARRRSQQPAISNETFGEIPSVPWLDQKQKARAKQIIADTLANGNDAWLLDDHRASLIVELPVFDIPILHEEIFYQIPQHGTSGAVAPVDLVAYRKKVEQNKVAEETFDPLQLIPFLDYENENDNPVEDKYRTLAHDILRGLVDPALKPDREQRHRLAQIIDSPSRHPTREEKDLLWRFRFSLVENARAVTKFLLAVDWSMESEVVQAAELLEQWRKRSPIAVTDALKLLGKHVAFQTNLVRDYAIETLAAAPDSELRLYLLQLVQALKYENTEMADPSSSRVSSSTAGSPSFINSSPQVSSLATFLINRAANNLELANYLYWYVCAVFCVFLELRKKLIVSDMQVLKS